MLKFRTGVDCAPARSTGCIVGAEAGNANFRRPYVVTHPFLTIPPHHLSLKGSFGKLLFPLMFMERL